MERQAAVVSGVRHYYTTSSMHQSRAFSSSAEKLWRLAPLCSRRQGSSSTSTCSSAQRKTRALIESAFDPQLPLNYFSAPPHTAFAFHSRQILAATPEHNIHLGNIISSCLACIKRSDHFCSRTLNLDSLSAMVGVLFVASSWV